MASTPQETSTQQPFKQDRPQPPRALQALLQEADININGSRPWDMQIESDRAYSRVLLHGSLGLGEGYMFGDWECHGLDELFYRLLSKDLDSRMSGWAKVKLGFEVLRQRLFNLQNESRAFQVGEQHYDTGNDVFERMLDPTMSYSCGYWAEANTLEEAQRAKLDLICRKLQLQPGDRLLDIGCGWGGLAAFAATNYGADVTGVTVSQEQQALARERCAGLPVKIELLDYRKLQGQFDKIVSVGMFEHVGLKNYPTYFRTAQRLLTDGGLFLLHTIGSYKSVPYTDPWIDRYIFRNGKLPSAEEITRAFNDLFLIEDWHNFGPDYDRTLMAWWHNFDRAWPELKSKYGQGFYRMWRFYLLSCAGFFRAKQGQLWQLVLSKRSRPGSYRSVR